MAVREALEVRADGAQRSSTRSAAGRRTSRPLARGEVAHLRLRRHRLRPVPRRPRPERHRLRRGRPLPALQGAAGDVRPELHRRRRQDHQARQRRGTCPPPASPSGTSPTTGADMASLGVLPPDVEPKATEHIPEIVALIERLIANGVAYAVDGDVYFEVAAIPGLRQARRARTSTSSRRARASRSTSASAIRSTSRCGRRPSRASRRGRARGGRAGRAGTSSARRWRCSYLGETFDIHGGGEDLIFPAPRERDRAVRGGDRRARSRACWLHNGFVNLGSREDVEVARQHAHDPGHGAAARRRGHAPVPPRHALPASPRVQRRAHRRGRAGARAGSAALKAEAERIAAEGSPRPGPTAGSSTRSPPSAPGSRRRWTTTSTRRRRSACSSTWPGFSTRPATRWRTARGSRRLPAGRGRARRRWRGAGPAGGRRPGAGAGRCRSSRRGSTPWSIGARRPESSATLPRPTVFATS